MTKCKTLLANAAIPLVLREDADKVYATLLAALDEVEQSTLAAILQSSPELTLQLSRALLGSQYILENCCRHPDLLFHWLLTDIPYAPLSAVRIVDIVELSCCDCATPEAVDKALRILRRRLMVGIIWRDLNRLSDFTELCQSMTAMAEACIQQAVDFHYQQLSEKHGKPIGQESQQPQPLVVLGMGKLGGSELNVSSDIDLIFAFPESGQTDHASRPLDNQQFFIRLGQRLIKTLHESTVDGFVFRVDMRLRPYGQSGALVSSFTALENYYATQGRDWERFAAIKARVVACASMADVAQSLVFRHSAIDQLQHILQPFVYRRYTDFSVIESLRQLKAMIVQEVRRKGMDGNVKLGAGGIRELEFIAQSFQLVRGGRESYLQERHWLAVMAQLRSAEVFDEGVADSLCSAYVFLRNTEHAIQGYQDQQTQQLPSAPRVQAVLAWMMGCDDWDVFVDVLDAHRQCVSEQFQQVIADPQEGVSPPAVSGDCLSLWQRGGAEQEESPLWERFLSGVGSRQPAAIIQQLERLRESWAVKRLSANARESLDVLVPQLMMVTFNLEQPDTTLLRMLAWLEKIVGRSSYITLLLENPTVLRHLAVLFQGSVWIADLLGQMPSLLDELLDADSLYTLPSKVELQNELRVRLLRVELDDVEATMEVLRYFKLAHSLRVAASDLVGCLPLMNVSDYLTWIAEVVLEQVLSLAWRQLSVRHGIPEALERESTSHDVCAPTPGFLIVAYGKLGGMELSYSSDLDLVFIYNADSHMMTNGDKPIDAQTFYTRLGQKVIHILNTRSLSGPLYEVDMRLRPSGNSGLLASTLPAFSRYQLSEAWTWEHQALVRARPIVGDSQLMADFTDLRQQILRQARGLSDLRAEVIEMRQKMRDHLVSSSRGQRKKHKNTDKKPLFHLKQDAGGIVDIEFMVQYAVLAWASQQPNIAEYTDNIRILQQMQASGFMDADKVSLLIEAYKAYRELTHRLALQQASSWVVEDQFPTYALPIKRQQVRELWLQLLCSDERQ
jgi:glutamate-ammonia-ligase adenylyltransferase